jgi:Transposase IS66 family/IS66 C-terminal element
VPASLQVIQYIRLKLACACCDRIVQAAAPSRPIERGIAGPGLLAHVLVSKYCDHLPLYRQSQIYARTGVELDRSTLAEWVGGSTRLLAPLVEALRRHVMAAGKLHKEIRGRLPDERREVRNTRSRPLLESLKQWFEETLGKLSRKSDTAMAVRYALGRWEALLRFCDDGRIEIDNNAAERALRVVALGRKNFLFAGSDGGGESAAAIYSLLGTAKLNGIDPERYLRTVLSRIADHPINRIEELLPWDVAASLSPEIDEAA